MSNNYKIYSNIPNHYKYKLMNTGTSANVYRTKDGKVYKEFFFTPGYSKDIVELANIKNDSFVFPRILIYKNEDDSNYLAGYTMEFVDGLEFDDIPVNTNIFSIIKAINDVELNILNVSLNYNLVILDIHKGNILYLPQNETFRLIDTDLYYRDYLNEDYIIYKNNIKEWSDFILFAMGCHRDAFFNERLNYHFDLAEYEGEYKPSRLFSEIITEIETHSGYNVNTLDDYNEGIRLIRRRQ